MPRVSSVMNVLPLEFVVVLTTMIVPDSMEVTVVTSTIKDVDALMIVNAHLPQTERIVLPLDFGRVSAAVAMLLIAQLTFLVGLAQQEVQDSLTNVPVQLMLTAQSIVSPDL